MKRHTYKTMALRKKMAAITAVTASAISTSVFTSFMMYAGVVATTKEYQPRRQYSIGSFEETTSFFRDNEFVQHFRLNKPLFYAVLARIKSRIERDPKKQAASGGQINVPEIMLANTLMWLAGLSIILTYCT